MPGIAAATARLPSRIAMMSPASVIATSAPHGDQDALIRLLELRFDERLRAIERGLHEGASGHRSDPLGKDLFAADREMQHLLGDRTEALAPFFKDNRIGEPRAALRRRDDQHRD